MKKLLSILLIAVMLVTATATTAFADGFSDLGADHWAYSAVSGLVAEGTINGFEDGTFRPAETVSRAQFVKMIGKGPTATSDKYVDVAAGDWYYDYVIYSGLEPVSRTRFEPNTPIKRGDVVNLLWKRNGAVTGAKAPIVITKQGDNADAVAWVYTKGIMVGDNYVDLRLDEPLTRAEAAALIVRARNNINVQPADFISNLDDKTLKAVYDGVCAFDDAQYSPDASITHGELAHMALRLATGGNEILYSNFSYTTPDFEHKYAKQMAVYGKYCVGEDKINLDYINSKATVQDVITAVSFGLVRSSVVALDYGATDNYYADAKPDGTTENKLLTMANNKNIMLYANGTIDSQRIATHRDLACVLLQADGISGFNKSFVYAENNYYIPYSIRTNTATYPQNTENFAVVLEDVPNEVYSTPFVLYGSGENVGVAKATLGTVKDFDDIFTTMLEDIVYVLGSEGQKIEIAFVPSLVVNNGNGYTYRVKIKINSVSDGVTLGNLLPLDQSVNDIALKNGMNIWADLETGGKLSGIFFDANNAGINKIVKVIE